MLLERIDIQRNETLELDDGDLDCVAIYGAFNDRGNYTVELKYIYWGKMRLDRPALIEVLPNNMIEHMEQTVQDTLTEQDFWTDPE